MQKRLFTALAGVLMSAVIAVQSVIPQRAKALAFTPNTTVYSEAAVLYNLDVGSIVYEKNADMKQMPAALTQIMTAVVVLENCSDITGEKITARNELFEQFTSYDYQSDLRYAEINDGDTLSVEDLLYAMMLTSSCEASIMLANHFGSGNEQAFVELMNAKAAELKMENTRFTNATGLYSARQVSTARDMMTLLNYAMTVPRFEGIACAQSYTPANAASLGKEEKWNWTHSNTMSVSSDKYFCNGVRGVKTGNLQEGGRCIACKASRDGNNYLLVCLNSPIYDEDGKSHFYHQEDAKNILEWAFMHLSFQSIIKDSTEMGERAVANADGNNYVIAKPATGYSCIWCDTADISSVQQIKTWLYDDNNPIPAPVKAGDKLGTLTLKLSGETLAEIDLVASSSVERSFWKYNLAEIPGFFKSKYLKKTWVWGLILSIIYIALCTFFAIRFRMERKKHPQRPRRMQ